MTELSPAQKAVAAFNERHELCGPFDDDWVEQCLAAALEAVADQVVPEDPKECNHFTNEVIRLNRMGVRAELLVIAAELRCGTTTTQQDNQ